MGPLGSRGRRLALVWLALSWPVVGCMPDVASLRGPADALDGGVSLLGGGGKQDRWDGPEGGAAGDDGGPVGVVERDAEVPEAGSTEAGVLPLPACGVPGTPCCREGTGPACGLGACLRGGCEAFAGLWARPEPLSCAPVGCWLRNPYTAGCSCPEGFEEQAIGPLRGPCPGGGGPASVTLRWCVGSARLPDSAFGGVWLLAGGTCLVPDRWQGACACPEGTAAVRAPVLLEDGRAATLGVCVGAGVGRERFEGAYRMGSGATTGCAEPNPRTGECSCPEGSREQWVTLPGPPGDHGPLVLCLRDGS